jgi:hypothetical protein
MLEREFIRVLFIYVSMMLRGDVFVKRLFRNSHNFLACAVIDFSRRASKQPLSVSIGECGGKLRRGAFAASRMACARIERM